MLGWGVLAVAVLFEVAGSVCLKLSYGFTRTLPSVLLFVFYGAAIACANVAIRYIDISIAYAIWAGLGTAIIATIGILYFGEPVTGIKIASLALIILGVIGLNLQMGK